MTRVYFLLGDQMKTKHGLKDGDILVQINASMLVGEFVSI